MIPIPSISTIHSFRLVTVFLAISVILFSNCSDKEPGLISQESRSTDWKTLKRHKTPEWLLDAKFGIYFHWGVYSVPASYDENYSRNMYLEGRVARQHHFEYYGTPMNFGYKNFISMFTAEQFNPDEWASLFYESGAKFAGPVAEHADGFAMWDTAVSKWNAANMGPRRDVVGELEQAIRNQGLKFAVSLHHHKHWGWYPTYDNDMDTSKPIYEGLYGPSLPATAFNPTEPDPPPSEEFQEQWLRKVKEVINAYRPDLLMFDDRMSIIEDHYRKDMVFHYYQSATKDSRDVALSYRDEDLPEGIGLPACRRSVIISRQNHAFGNPFITEVNDDFKIAVSSIDLKSNSYRWNGTYESSEILISELVDMVSRNCLYLLNITPRADGIIPDEVCVRLRTMGEWLNINGEAIYNTRPWETYAEIPRNPALPLYQVKIAINPLGQDIRFTQSKNEKYLYAFLMKWPGEYALISSLNAESLDETKGIESIMMLGLEQKLPWSLDTDGLRVQLPECQSTGQIHVLKITWK